MDRLIKNTEFKNNNPLKFSDYMVLMNPKVDESILGGVKEAIVKHPQQLATTCATAIAVTALVPVEAPALGVAAGLGAVYGAYNVVTNMPKIKASCDNLARESKLLASHDESYSGTEFLQAKKVYNKVGQDLAFTIACGAGGFAGSRFAATKACQIAQQPISKLCSYSENFLQTKLVNPVLGSLAARSCFKAVASRLNYYNKFNNIFNFSLNNLTKTKIDNLVPAHIAEIAQRITPHLSGSFKTVLTNSEIASYYKIDEKIDNSEKYNDAFGYTFNKKAPSYLRNIYNLTNHSLLN